MGPKGQVRAGQWGYWCLEEGCQATYWALVVSCGHTHLSLPYGDHRTPHHRVKAGHSQPPTKSLCAQWMGDWDLQSSHEADSLQGMACRKQHPFSGPDEIQGRGMSKEGLVCHVT